MPAETPVKIDRLDEVASSYDAVLCDVWGVVHNGISPFPLAVQALQAWREAGKTVVLITNSPRPAEGVISQFGVIGVADDAWDDIVTSGDVTRRLVADGPRKLFFIGPDRDMLLVDGLDVELVGEEEAEAILCTGLFDDEAETPDDYHDQLNRLVARDLPFICANPDQVVERGDRMIYCAGALATAYEKLGGRTRIAGTVLFVPVIEELFFRGYLQSRLDIGGWPGKALAIVVPTAAFAALHGRYLEAGTAGVIFALLVMRRGRLADAIAAHAVANALIAAVAAWRGDWGLI